MPEQDELKATRPDTSSPAPHPVLEDMAEAARLTGDAEAFLSPTRAFNYPHLEEGDWPRDLDDRETRGALEHLADIADNVSGCVTGIRCQHGVPDSVKPELDKIADLLTEAGRRITALGEETPAQQPQAVSPARQASTSFPRTPSASTAGTEQPAATRSSTSPVARPPMP